MVLDDLLIGKITYPGKQGANSLRFRQTTDFWLNFVFNIFMHSVYFLVYIASALPVFLFQ